MDSGTSAAIIAGSRCARLVCLWSQKMTILAQLPHHPARTEEGALAALVMAIGGPAFATQALAALNAPLQAASWSVYRVWRDRTPELCLSASHGVADTTRACFDAYRDGLYRRDCSFDLARKAPVPGGATVLQMRAVDAPTPEHRERIYRRHGILERLSVVSAEDDGALLRGQPLPPRAPRVISRDCEVRAVRASSRRWCWLVCGDTWRWLGARRASPCPGRVAPGPRPPWQARVRGPDGARTRRLRAPPARLEPRRRGRGSGPLGGHGQDLPHTGLPAARAALPQRAVCPLRHHAVRGRASLRTEGAQSPSGMTARERPCTDTGRQVPSCLYLRPPLRSVLP